MTSHTINRRSRKGRARRTPNIARGESHTRRPGSKEFPVSIPALFRLDGKVAVVTGASSGLGVAFARGLAEAGADVALGARRVDRMAEVVSEVEGLGRRAIAVATDVTNADEAPRLVSETV